MNAPLSEEEIDRLARKRVRAKMGWYTHAVVFSVVNLFVFSRSVYAFGSHSWSLGPFLGWGLGLALHGISVFWLGKSSDFRENMVEKERERLRRRNARQDEPY